MSGRHVKKNCMGVTCVPSLVGEKDGRLCSSGEGGRNGKGFHVCDTPPTGA